MITEKSFIFPSPSVSDKPSLSIDSAHSLGGADSLEKIDLKAVPAFSALIPALAIRPAASAVSSML